MEYEMIWRNKWLTSNAHSIPEMVKSLRNAAQHLEDMHEAGIVLENSDDISDDYAFLATGDSKIAEQFGFYEREESDEDEKE